MATSMNPEVLTSMAEIAITLAGFTGLVVAFRSSKTSVVEELRRLVFIFILCFTAIVGSILPIIVDLLAPDTELSWQVTAIFLATAALAVELNAVRQVISGRITVRFPIPTYLTLSALLIVGVLQVLLLLGLLPGDPFGYLLAGILWFIVHAGYLFVTTLFWASDD